MFESEKLNQVLNYSKELISSGPDTAVGKGIELSISTILGKTLTKSLPAPLNFAVPFILEKLILLHGVDAGRDALITALKWVKMKTAESDSLLLELE